MKRIFAVLIILAIATLACGSSNTGSAVSTAAPGVPVATAAPVVAKTYNVGDVVAVQDQTITLNSAAVTGTTLKANFTVANTGSADLNVSSMLSFSAKADDGTKLEQDIMNCGTSGMDGKVLAGDKLKGDICWTVAGTAPYKIYYEASLFGSGAIVWQVK